jgi:calcineurin-like phosphoesterase
MQYSKKELKKYALKLTTVGKRERSWTLIILLLGILCSVYLISSGKNLVEKRRLLRQMEISKIRIEVLNGTTIKGLAEKTAEFLRKKGFDVVRYGNASKEIVETVIIDRVDPELKNATLTRDIIRQGKISFEPHPLRLFDVTIVLGSDFKVKREPFFTKFTKFIKNK